MNPHASSSCLLAVIANLLAEAAVRDAHIVSRSAIIADHNSNLLIVLKKPSATDQESPIQLQL